jgi:DNA-binding transcriptional LysR family regulator
MISPRDLPLLPVFVAVASVGSFTGAARELRLAKSVVSKHVSTLEERCGVRLIERSTRRLHLTQIGEQVFDAAQQVMGSVRSLEQVVEGNREAPSGTLRVTLPQDPWLSAMVSPIAASLVRRYPSLKVDLVADDAIRDLVTEGLDVALRLGTVRESSYIVRRLGSEREIVVAAAGAFDELGELESPRRLGSVPWVVHSALRVRSSLRLRSERGDGVQVNVRVLAATNSITAMRDLLLAGAGFGLLPEHTVRDDLKAGRLRHICPEWYHRRLSLHALLPTKHGPPRVRLFLTALAAAARPLGFDAA